MQAKHPSHKIKINLVQIHFRSLYGLPLTYRQFLPYCGSTTQRKRKSQVTRALSLLCHCVHITSGHNYENWLPIYSSQPVGRPWNTREQVTSASAFVLNCLLFMTHNEGGKIRVRRWAVSAQEEPQNICNECQVITKWASTNDRVKNNSCKDWLLKLIDKEK